MLIKNYGKKEIGKINIESVILGMKELPLLFYPGSSMDPNEGIRF